MSEFLKFIAYTINVVQNKDYTFWQKKKLKIIYDAFVMGVNICISILEYIKK